MLSRDLHIAHLGDLDGRAQAQVFAVGEYSLLERLDEGGVGLVGTFKCRG